MHLLSLSRPGESPGKEHYNASLSSHKMKSKEGTHLGKPRTIYSQENMVFLPTKLIHEAHCFCAFFEKWHKILKTDIGSQMLFEEPNKGHVH